MFTYNRYHNRYNKALMALTHCGLAETKHLGLIHRWLWSIGINIRPIWYTGIICNTVWYIGLFTLLFGLVSFALPQQPTSLLLSEIALASISAGMLTALFIERTKQKLSIPEWHTLDIE